MTRTARVFTDGAQAKAHAARTGEDVITQKGLAQLPGKISITARLDGVDGELGFDPRARSRTARRSFDPGLLRETLSPEAYRQALDLATLELPENPGESRSYSEKLAKAWFEATSPVGIVHRLAERPGVFVFDDVEGLTTILGNEGVAAAVYCAQLRHELTDPETSLSVAALELDHELGSLRGMDQHHETRQLLLEAAAARLTEQPGDALSTLNRLCGSDGLAFAFHAAQARIEAALLADPDPAAPRVLGALAQLEAMCQGLQHSTWDEWTQFYGTPLEWGAYLTDRAHQAVGLPPPTGELRVPARFPQAGAELSAALDAVVRAPGAMPTLPRTTGVVAAHPELQAAAEARWATVCANLEQRYDVVASTSAVELDALQDRGGWQLLWADAGGALAEDPTGAGVVPAIREAHWVGVDRGGRVLSYSAQDAWDATPKFLDRRDHDGHAANSNSYRAGMARLLELTDELVLKANGAAPGSTPAPSCTRVEAAPPEDARVLRHDDLTAALTPARPSNVWDEVWADALRREYVELDLAPALQQGDHDPELRSDEVAAAPPTPSARPSGPVISPERLGALLATLELPDAESA